MPPPYSPPGVGSGVGLGLFCSSLLRFLESAERKVKQLCNRPAHGVEFPLDPWYRPSGSLFPPVVWGGRRPDCMAGEQPQVGVSLNPRGLGIQRIYTPEGSPEAISPGEGYRAHRRGIRPTRRPLSRGWGTLLWPRGCWTGCRACSEPRSYFLGYASTAWAGPPSP